MSQEKIYCKDSRRYKSLHKMSLHQQALATSKDLGKLDAHISAIEEGVSK